MELPHLLDTYRNHDTYRNLGHERFDTELKQGQNCLSRIMRKPTFRICENKDADQLRGNRESDQRLCFRYTDSTIPILPKSEISSL